MKEKYIEDLDTIRSLMEQRVKFISLSGMSGILAGSYAVIAGLLAHWWIHTSHTTMYTDLKEMQFTPIVYKILILAIITFIFSLVTAIHFSSKKAKSEGLSIWSNASKKVLFHFLVPFGAGALFVLLLLWRQYIFLIAPSCLIFYGIAVFSASHYMPSDIKYLGIAEIFLGLLAVAIPNHGLTFWIIGFGGFHIIYGLFRYIKFDR